MERTRPSELRSTSLRTSLLTKPCLEQVQEVVGLRKEKPKQSWNLRGVMTTDWEPRNDGVTHINVYSKALTDLGRLLTNFAHTPFNHTDLGHFESVEGFWYWRKTRGVDDELRKLYGFRAKQRGREVIDAGFEFVDEEDILFREDVVEAIRCKLRQNWYITEMLYQSTLPLAHYYFYGDINNNPKVIYLPEYGWQIEELERIRTLCKEKYL